MLLSPEELLRRVRENKLVEGLSDRELTNPEGAGFDLRLGEVYEISGKAFLGIDERETPEIKLVRKYEEGKRNTIEINPGDYYLVSTIEKVNTPLDVAITFIPRTTTFRSGLFLRTGVAHPGYSGKLTFGLKNEGPVTVTFEMGCRFVHAQFHLISGKGSHYRGQWQGGRVTTTKREKQV